MAARPPKEREVDRAIIELKGPIDPEKHKKFKKEMADCLKKYGAKKIMAKIVKKRG